MTRMEEGVNAMWLPHQGVGSVILMFNETAEIISINLCAVESTGV